MLRRLHVCNYLLIDLLDLELGRGLSIITGETGSGKSILIGALGLAMGERADAGMLRDPGRRCVIELELDLGGQGLREWFELHELPYEAHTLLRRQLEPGGRSRAFINDTPVRLEQLRELGARLMHVHSQHHTLLLNDPTFQLGLVDHVAGLKEKVDQYRHEHRAWHAVEQELSRLKEEEAKARTEADFIAFQLNELDEAALRQGEQADLEVEVARADHAEELVQALQQVDEGVSGERGLLALVARLKQPLLRAGRFDPGVQQLAERLESLHIELKDIGNEASDRATSAVLDPQEAARKRDRLDLMIRLQQKHRVDSLDALLALQEDLRTRSRYTDSLSGRIAELSKQAGTLHAELLLRGGAISKARTKAIGALVGKVEALLHELGMPHAVFRIEQYSTDSPGTNGLDSVRAMFSANKDRVLAPLDKAASGGELSRVMLALISLSAASQGLPTVVFDEIDTGVSGEVADRVGDLLASMGRDRQVLAITHLPQIAGKGDHHLLVAKSLEADVVRTTIEPLEHERRVAVIAGMLSGRKTTKAAMQHARELMKQK